MKKRAIFLRVVWIGLMVSLLTACAPAAAPTAAPRSTARVVVLPILDSLPIYVAQKEGLFEKNNLIVEIIPAALAPERDQIMAAGKADGMINDAISTMFYNKDGVRIQIVRYARAAAPGVSLFRILAGKGSGITSVDQLKGVPVGISEGSVIAYVTDRLLEAEGLTKEQIKTVAVPKISDRMAMLGSGELKAGTLPEPLSSMALAQGSTQILDDTKHPEYCFSTYSFQKTFIDQNPAAVRSFLKAIEEATNLINKDPGKYAQVLVDQKILSSSLATTFPVPQFVKSGVPTEVQFKDVLAWTREKGYLQKDISYADSVNASFLP